MQPECNTAFWLSAATSAGPAGELLYHHPLFTTCLPRGLREIPLPASTYRNREQQHHCESIDSNMGDIILPRRMFLWCMSVIYMVAFVSLYVQIPGETL